MKLLTIVFAVFFHRSFAIEKRIVNGVRVAPGETPFIASLQSPRYDGHFCTGVYIGEGWVLTASHCFRELEMIGVTVELGSVDLKTETNTYVVIQGFKKKFDVATYRNDIAVVQLNMTVDSPLYSMEHPTIPVSSDIEISTCQIFGYGSVDYAAEKSQYLLQGNVQIITQQECVESMGPVSSPEYPQMFCAKGIRGVDACGGDSGGPLICHAGNTSYLIGLVSYGMGCGNTAGAYTNVIYHGRRLRILKKRRTRDSIESNLLLTENRI